jgi:predicted metalloendopeptidase
MCAQKCPNLPREDLHAGRPAKAADDAKAVFALGNRSWPGSSGRRSRRDAVKTYNKMAVTKIVADFPGFDWMAWPGRRASTRRPSGCIAQPSFFKGFAAMVPDPDRDVEGMAGGAASRSTRRS